MSKTSIACIAMDKNRILIAHRNPTGQMGDRWEFPGGKVEEGETPETAIVREMREEFGITVKVIEKITENSFIHNDQTVKLLCYCIKVPHKGRIFKYALTEHTEYDWVDIDSIPQDNFVDSDLKLYPAVREYVKNIGSKK